MRKDLYLLTFTIDRRRSNFALRWSCVRLKRFAGTFCGWSLGNKASHTSPGLAFFFSSQKNAASLQACRLDTSQQLSPEPRKVDRGASEGQRGGRRKKSQTYSAPFCNSKGGKRKRRMWKNLLIFIESSALDSFYNNNSAIVFSCKELLQPKFVITEVKISS